MRSKNKNYCGCSRAETRPSTKAKIGYQIMLTALAIIGMPVAALAGQCDASGGISYLGVTSNNSKSVWLSQTSPGSFELESAQGNQTVDQWSKNKKGLHLSLSPNVSNGNGGTHKLYDVGSSKPCLLDTQNQKAGFVFPPIFRPPPGWIRPPEVTPITPELPPIGTLPPPTGITPGMPGGMTPPIGTLPPPTGITPGMPGGVTPPIGTLPPPTGITPALPGGVTPPIGTLPPPTGITPGMPGGVTPPIGTLPPPTGITPGLPGAVTPPIGTLPPVTGITPALPGGVTPPIGTLPPPTGITPTEPGVGAPPNAEAIQIVNTTIPILPCATVSRGEGGAVSGTRPQDCIGMVPTAKSNEDVGSAPITPGREFGVEALWNVWADSRYLDTSDQRHGLDIDGNMSSFVVGADRRVNDDLVAGVSLQGVYSRSDGFNNGMSSDSNGFVIAPYIGYQLSRNWAIDAFLGFGRTENNQQISVLEGDYTAQSYSISAVANGQYPLGVAFVRPKVSFYYVHTHADGYDMKGNVSQTPITLHMSEYSYNYGVVEAATELNQTFITSGGTPVMPYVELTARCEFERQNDGDILTGNLSQTSTSPWSGALRTGARAMITRSTNIETSAGYLSLGQNGLDIWELRLFLSHSF